MCGILAILHSELPAEELKKLALSLSKRIRHRGPDWNGIHIQKHNDGTHSAIAHERLAIVDTDSGHQPLFNLKGNVACTVNGEIYNHESLKDRLDKKVVECFKSHSDCEPIAHLYSQYKEGFVPWLDGMFAFVVSDEITGEYLAARDPLGICPMYVGFSGDGAVIFSSELKAIHDVCPQHYVFEPGSIWTSSNPQFTKWFKPDWLSEEIPSTPLDLAKLREALESSVSKRLMADVPFGLLLSGGLDSSIIASIAVKKMKGSAVKRRRTEGLESFSIGLKNSPDLVAAKNVADYLGTIHHEITFTIEEGIQCISDVIYHIETFDVTTIRASTPMYILARYVKANGIKMVLSGEGADEIFGGYLYFHKAPNKEEFFKELQRKMKALSQYDLLRANKSCSAWGVEPRVPFLDMDFMKVAMQLDPEEKLCRDGRIEKWPLRKAFEDSLPKEVVWRQKEQFSDGVGYGWIDGLRAHAEKQVSDNKFAFRERRYPLNTPQTKEAYWYREMFEKHFPAHSSAQSVPWERSVACSTAAALAWDENLKNNIDASGRAVIGVHVQSNIYIYI
eukprot:GHVL01005376.1.p1 GENE.GHVL01005376.1~~GHVL01005376.1.p1  ORF type:complete len:562 (+),score=95.01 GHVL01005376.1:40-1725(+)